MARGGQLRLLLHERDSQAVAALKLAVIHLQRACDDFQQRGFAGAVAADQADALADLHGEAGSVEEGAVAEGGMSVENRDEGHTFSLLSGAHCPGWTRVRKACKVRLAE